MKNFFVSILDSIRYSVIAFFLLAMFRLPESSFVAGLLFVLLLLLYIKKIYYYLRKATHKVFK